ncbi:hypothetical protein FKM82_021062 [Ascaphus truei]
MLCSLRVLPGSCSCVILDLPGFDPCSSWTTLLSGIHVNSATPSTTLTSGLLNLANGHDYSLGHSQALKVYSNNSFNRPSNAIPHSGPAPTAVGVWYHTVPTSVLGSSQVCRHTGVTACSR